MTTASNSTLRDAHAGTEDTDRQGLVGTFSISSRDIDGLRRPTAGHRDGNCPKRRRTQYRQRRWRKEASSTDRRRAGLPCSYRDERTSTARPSMPQGFAGRTSPSPPRSQRPEHGRNAHESSTDPRVRAPKWERHADWRLRAKISENGLQKSPVASPPFLLPRAPQTPYGLVPLVTLGSARLPV